MRGAPFLMALVALTALLTPGCVREKDNPYQPAVDDDRGAARIIVQDDRAERVKDATVLVYPAGAFGKTDGSGIYMALDLAPGNATVTVNADCYADARKAFQVPRGDVVEVVVFVDHLC